MHYDFDAFLNSLKYLDKQDILDTAYKRHKNLDKHSTTYTTENRVALQSNITALLYWMETGKKQEGLKDVDFAKFKPICENLVKKNQMESSALLVFEK